MVVGGLHYLVRNDLRQLYPYGVGRLSESVVHGQCRESKAIQGQLWEVVRYNDGVNFPLLEG
jgi:hypothetical protein